MNTTRNNKANLATTIETIYGVNPVQCEPHVIEWGAEQLVKDGVDAVNIGAQWKALNAKREHRGIYSTRPDYHHPLYAAYYA